MRRLIALGFVGALVMCANTTVRVEQAPEFVPPRAAKVSVLGVFHDGRMSEPAWYSLSPKVSAALGRTSCEIGYSQALRDANPELAKTVEKYVRENGIDDTLLDRVAPNASGELVMVLMSYRQIPSGRDGGARQAHQPPPQISNGRMTRSQGMSSSRYVPEEEHVFELSASLFSVSLHKLVAQIDLRYTGDDLDEAMDAFANKLRALVPDAKCVGWKWPNPISSDEAVPDAGSEVD